MIKMTIKIEANSREEFLELLEQRVKEEVLMKKIKIEPSSRKNKGWTEFEENFLIDNYRSKKISFIAKSLQRPELAVRHKLFLVRKKYKLPALKQRCSGVVKENI